MGDSTRHLPPGTAAPAPARRCCWQPFPYRRWPPSAGSGAERQRRLHLRPGELLGPRPEHRQPPAQRHRLLLRRERRAARAGRLPVAGVRRPSAPARAGPSSRRATRNLPPGYKGSAVVESDQPVVALQAKDVHRNGFFMIDGNTTSVLAGSSKMYLPLIAEPRRRAERLDGPLRRPEPQRQRHRLRHAHVPQQLAPTARSPGIPHKPGSSGAEAVRLPQRRPADPAARHAVPRPRHLRRPGELHRLGAHRDLQERPGRRRRSEQFLTATADTYNSLYSPFASYRAHRRVAR